MEAPSNRPDIAAAETANSFTSSCLFMIPPYTFVLPLCERDCSASDRLCGVDRFDARPEKRSNPRGQHTCVQAGALSISCKDFRKAAIFSQRTRSWSGELRCAAVFAATRRPSQMVWLD